MTKYSKVYLRNKKQSNVSMLLRYNFLKSIFVDGMSVKNAAIKWRLHYSTAKIIARIAKKTKEAKLFRHIKYQPTPSLKCGWKPVTSTFSSNDYEVKCKLQIDDGDSEHSTRNLISSSKSTIEIVSTVGWTYLDKGSQTISK